MSGSQHLSSLTGLRFQDWPPQSSPNPSVRAMFLQHRFEHLTPCLKSLIIPCHFSQVKGKFLREAQKSGTSWPLLPYPLVPSCSTTEPSVQPPALPATPQIHQPIPCVWPLHKFFPGRGGPCPSTSGSVITSSPVESGTFSTCVH